MFVGAGRGEAAESGPCCLLREAFPDDPLPPGAVGPSTFCLTEPRGDALTAGGTPLCADIARACLYQMRVRQGLCVPRPSVHDRHIVGA